MEPPGQFFNVGCGEFTFPFEDSRNDGLCFEDRDEVLLEKAVLAQQHSQKFDPMKIGHWLVRLFILPNQCTKYVQIVLLVRPQLAAISQAINHLLGRAEFCFRADWTWWMDSEQFHVEPLLNQTTCPSSSFLYCRLHGLARAL
jgi:hypothetical protein